MGELFHKASGFIALLLASATAYLWNNGALDDRALTFLMAGTGIFALMAIDIPFLSRCRKEEQDKGG